MVSVQYYDVYNYIIHDLKLECAFEVQKSASVHDRVNHNNAGHTSKLCLSSSLCNIIFQKSLLALRTIQLLVIVSLSGCGQRD